MIQAFSDKNLIKRISLIFLYIAAALLAISDTGIQLLILVEIGPGSRTLRLIAMWLLFFKVLMTRYSKKEFAILAPIALLAMYNYTVAGNTFCVYTILFIAAAKEIDYSTLFKTLFYSTLGALLFVGLLSCFEIGSPTKLVEDFGRGMIETRYCFGLYHPNIWHQAIARCIVFGCIGYYKQLNWIHLLILFVLNYFIYTLSVSRTGLIATGIFLILIISYKYFSRFMHTFFVKLCAVTGLAGIYGLYIYFTVKLTGEYHYAAEMFNWKVTTGRLRQSVNYLSENAIKLFSSRFPDDGTLFDCGFFRLFYEGGYLWAGLFFITLFALLLLAMKKNWDIIIPVCVFFVFCSLYEFDPVTRPSFNVVTFFLPLLVFSTTAEKFHSFMLSSQRKGSLKSSLSSSAK